MDHYQDEDNGSQSTSADIFWTLRYATDSHEGDVPTTSTPLQNMDPFLTVAYLSLHMESPYIDPKHAIARTDNMGYISKGYGCGNFSSALKVDGMIAKLPRIPPGHHMFNKASFYRDLITELRISQHDQVTTCDYVTQIKGMRWNPGTRSSDYSPETSVYLWPIPMYEVAEGTMSALLKSRPPFSTKINLSLDIAMGLDRIHDYGIVHSDLKAENILIFLHPQRGQMAKLADFGCATIWEEDSGARKRLEGFTNLWAAPECYTEMSYQEQCRADVYSFGLMIWQLITDGNTPLKWLDAMEHDSQSLAILKESDCILPLTLEAVENLSLNEAEKMVCREVFGGTLDALNERRADYVSPLLETYWVDDLWGSRDFELSSLGDKDFVGPIPSIDRMVPSLFEGLGQAYPSPSVDKRLPVQLFDSIKEVSSLARERGDEPLLSVILYQLFLCHYLGHGTERDLKAAMSTLAEAAKYGSLEARNIVVQFFDAHGAEIPSELAVCDWLEALVHTDTPGAATALKGLDPDRWQRLVVSTHNQASEGTESELDFLSDLLGGPDVVDITPLRLPVPPQGPERWTYPNDEPKDRNSFPSVYALTRRFHSNTAPGSPSSSNTISLIESFGLLRKRNQRAIDKLVKFLLFFNPCLSGGQGGDIVNALDNQKGMPASILRLASTFLFTQSSTDTVQMPTSRTRALLRAVMSCDIDTVQVLVDGAPVVGYSALSMAASLHCSDILDLLVQKYCSNGDHLTPWEIGVLIYVAATSNPLRSIRLHGFTYVPEVIATFELLDKYVQLWYSNSHSVIELAMTEAFKHATLRRRQDIIKHVMHPFFTSSIDLYQYLPLVVLASDVGAFDLLLDNILAKHGWLDELDCHSKSVNDSIMLACRAPNPFFIQRLMDPKIWHMSPLDQLMTAFDSSIPLSLCPFQYATFNSAYETADFLAKFTGKVSGGGCDWQTFMFIVISSQESLGYTMIDYLIRMQEQYPTPRGEHELSVVIFLATYSAPVSGQRRATLKVYWANILNRFSHLLETPEHGMTPMTAAIRTHNSLMVETLLDAGIDPNVPDSKGLTILDAILIRRVWELNFADPDPANTFIPEVPGPGSINDLTSMIRYPNRVYQGDDHDEQLDEIYDMVRRRGGTSLRYKKEHEYFGSLRNWTRIFMAIRSVALGSVGLSEGVKKLTRSMGTLGRDEMMNYSNVVQDILGEALLQYASSETSTKYE